MADALQYLGDMGWRYVYDAADDAYLGHTAQKIKFYDGRTANDKARLYTREWFDVVAGFSGCAHVLAPPKPLEPTIEEQLLAAILANTDAIDDLRREMRQTSDAMITWMRNR